MAFDPATQTIVTRDGNLMEGSPTVAKVVATLAQSDPALPLLIWFHGGLVDTASAQSMAKRVGAFMDGKAASVYYLWDTGLGNEVPDAIVAIAKRYAFGKAIDLITKFINVRRSPAGSAFAATGHSDELSEIEKTALMDAVAKDPAFQSEAAALEGRKGLAATHLVAGDTKTRKDLDVDRKLQEMYDEASDKKGFTVMPAIIFLGKQVVEIAQRVLKRTNNRRTHGLQQCIIEEIARQLQIAGAVWADIRSDAELNFKEGSPGKALIDGLLTVPNVANRTIILVGHSAGSIMVEQFLKGMRGKGLKFHVRLLASASRCDSLAATLSGSKAEVKSIRCFGMDDATERAENLLDIDPIRTKLPSLVGFYKGSLLYMVSGALEEADGDTPLAGMQRYLVMPDGDDFLSNAERVCANTIAEYPDIEFVWTPTPTGAPAGFQGQSVTHGGFDESDELKPNGCIASLLVLT